MVAELLLGGRSGRGREETEGKCRWEGANQLEEHAELCSFAPVARAFRFRECDLGDSFERGQLCQRLFDVWFWKSFYQNPHMFPTLGCLINMVRIKQLLWNRYGFFFDVDTIQEVYPEQELAEWVI